METLTIVITDERITVVGEIDIASARSLTDAVVSVAAGRIDQILLDLRAVTFIDSSGLHALTRLCSAVPTLQVVDVSPHVTRVLELAGLSDAVLPRHDEGLPASADSRLSTIASSASPISSRTRRT